MTTETSSKAASAPLKGGALRRIAVGLNGFDEGEDALVLGAALAAASDAELMLVAVHPSLMVVLPSGMDWSSLRQAASATLREARDRVAPQSRMVVESDVSVPRALARVVKREHRDLLVLGSSRQGPEGSVRIGARTRQLLGQFECALAVAPRGLHGRRAQGLKRIAVGYADDPESQAALDLAARLARSAGAHLHVQAVFDDRLPLIGWSSLSRQAMAEYWAEMTKPQMEALRQATQEAAEATEMGATIDVQRGRPADHLLELSRTVDLLVIGSRRWGAATRVLLGSTGEALMHDSACPVMAVPRPPDGN